MKKKMVALLLASFMAFSITACGGNDTSEEAQAETNTEESTESAETEGSEQEAAEEEPAEEPAQEDDGIINFFKLHNHFIVPCQPCKLAFCISWIF